MPTDNFPEPSAPPTVFRPSGPPLVKELPRKVPEPRFPPPDASRWSAGRPDVKRAPPKPSVTPSPKPSSERPAVKEKAAGEAPKVDRVPDAKAEPRSDAPKAAPKSSAEAGKTAAAAASAYLGSSSSGVLSLPKGTVVKISGLKATPQLNGELGQVLRIKEDQPDRTIIRTRFGEKALKEANIEVGLAAVCPRYTVPAIAGLVTSTLVSVVDIFLGDHGMNMGTVASPVLAILWLFGTLGLCAWLYRPCRPEGTWVPAMSTLGAAPPARNIFRVGFVVVAILLATSSWLYGEILMTRLGDIPDAPETLDPPALPTEIVVPPAEDAEPIVEDEEAQAEEAQAEEAQAAANSTEKSAVSDAALTQGAANPASPAASRRWWQFWAASEAAPAQAEANATKGANATENETLNDSTNTTRTTAPVFGPPPEWMIRRSVWFGYATAAAVGAQGVFGLQERMLSVQSMLHMAAAVVFTVSAMQHCQQSTLLLSSVRGEALLTSSGLIRFAVKFRRQLGDYAPIVLLALPLASQMFSRDKDASSRRRPTFQSALDSSGLLTSARCMQWGSVLLYAVFVSSYALDFSVCGGIPPGEEEPEV